MFNNIRNYWIIRNSKAFDEEYYLMVYEDVRKSDLDPLLHYVSYGWKEGRNPSASFDTAYYLMTYADVRASGLCPLVHYIRYGRKEGRRPSEEAGSLFSQAKPAPAPKVGWWKYLSIDMARKSMLYLRMYGLKPLLHKIAFTVKAVQNPTPEAPVTILAGSTKHLAALEHTITEFDHAISVVIPTKNAGDDFEALLKILGLQRGFKQIEIVVVDSGSTDDTVEIANAHGAKVVQILPEEFTHSYARNLGAENARGDILLFTVQDAMPPSDTWLAELMSVLVNYDVTAVSCAEFPREDADLFYRVVTWNHYRFLEVNGRDKIMQLPAVADSISLRKNGQLSDLACLIPRDVFMQYKYRLWYAEDLDLGIRLIQDGKKIAFLGNTRIVHSHARPAYYFLKRGYVDNIFLTEVFKNEQLPKIVFKEITHDIVFSVDQLNNTISDAIRGIPFPARAEAVIAETRKGFRSAFYQYYSRKPIHYNRAYVDENFIQFVESVTGLLDEDLFGNRYSGFLLHALMDYCNILFDYIQQTYEMIDEEQANDIVDCLHKQFAQVIGAHLAFYTKQCSEIDRAEFQQYFGDLAKGV